MRSRARPAIALARRAATTTSTPARICVRPTRFAPTTATAEAFARAYGSDVLVAASAGVAPALMVAFDTRRAMKEKNLSLDDHFPKSLQQLSAVRFDLIVNMSGVELPPGTAPVRVWKVRDPIAKYERRLIELGAATEKDLRDIDRMSKDYAEEEARLADEMPMPDPSTVALGVYAGSGEQLRPRVEIVKSPFAT